jgi:hypothetical protein
VQTASRHLEWHQPDHRTAATSAQDGWLVVVEVLVVVVDLLVVLLVVDLLVVLLVVLAALAQHESLLLPLRTNDTVLAASATRTVPLENRTVSALFSARTLGSLCTHKSTCLGGVQVPC